MEKRMSRSMIGVATAAAVVCLTAVTSLAQTTTSSSETKSFEVLAVTGNELDVKLPEGTRELTVPDDFRFTVNGQQLSVHQLKPGMKGTATITTRTTVTPVTVTEVKDGTVVVRSSAGVIVRTNEGVKSFTQADIDKRGIKLMRAGQPAQVSDFREGDKLSATFITPGPPHVLTEKEVQALVPTNAAAAPRSGSMTVTYYVAITFTVTDDGTVAPGEAIECPSAETAILRAEVLSRIRGNVGAVAFSRTGDPDVGVFEDAVVLKTFGEVPTDLTMLF